MIEQRGDKAEIAIKLREIIFAEKNKTTSDNMVKLNKIKSEIKIRQTVRQSHH